MRTWQWVIIGFFFMAMANWFIFLDTGFGCDIFDESTVQNADIISCINNEIFDPIIWIFYPLSYLFIFIGVVQFFVDSRAVKKEITITEHRVEKRKKK